MSKTKKYDFADHPEHKSRLGEWRDKWIASTLSTKPMDDEDRAIMRVAVVGLYEAAKLTPPTAERIIFCASPISGAIAASIASGVWWLRENPQEHRKLFGRSISEADLMAAMGLACEAATAAGLRAVRHEPPAPDPRLRGSDATRAATRAATRDATSDATIDATIDATRDATIDAHAHLHGDVAAFLIRCTDWWHRFWDPGNQGGWGWGSAWASYVSFFRHVAQLPIDYEKWQHYENAAIHGGPRFMHAKFCIVSDRPVELHNEIREGQGRPHRIDGPAIRWLDGWELHFIAGIRVKPAITAGQFTATDIRDESNAEVRRVMVDKYEGEDRGKYLRDIGAKVIDEDIDLLGFPRRLMRQDQVDDEPIVVVEVKNSSLEPDGSRKTYTLRVPPTVRTCHEAIAWTFGQPVATYRPQVET